MERCESKHNLAVLSGTWIDSSEYSANDDDDDNDENQDYNVSDMTHKEGLDPVFKINHFATEKTTVI